MAKGPAALVEAPTSSPPLHNLIATAFEVDETDDRWELGFTFRPETCACAQPWDWDCPPDEPADKPTKPAPEEPLGFVDYEPFSIIGSFECGPIGYDPVEQRAMARRQLEASQHRALEAEFWTGALRPTNPHLAMLNAVVLNAQSPGPSGAVSPGRALCLLADGLADCCPDSRSTIHAPVCVASLWSDSDRVLEDRDGRLRTKVRGDYVVAGSGYPGTGPPGWPNPPGAQWVFATSGIVQVRLGVVQAVPENVAQAFDRRLNVETWRAERSASAVWDTCCLLAVLVDVT